MDARNLQNGKPAAQAPTYVRVLLLLSWAASAIGYHGAWIAHETAALTLSGVDMGEFVKFLPGVMDGSLRVWRELFYLPVPAVTASIALLVGSKWTGFGRGFGRLAGVLALLFTLQLLPPAWSPATLRAEEFRVQVIALVVLWLSLAGSWLLSRLPLRLAFAASGALGLGASVLTAWQFLMVEPQIEEVYSRAVAIGWGFVLCQLGLVLLTAVSTVAMLGKRSQTPWK